MNTIFYKKMIFVGVVFLFSMNYSFAQQCSVMPSEVDGSFESYPAGTTDALLNNGWRGSPTWDIVFSYPDNGYTPGGGGSINSHILSYTDNSFVICAADADINNPNGAIECGASFIIGHAIEVHANQQYTLSFYFSGLTPKQGIWRVTIIDQTTSTILHTTDTPLSTNIAWDSFQYSFDSLSSTGLLIQFTACGGIEAVGSEALMGIDNIDVTEDCPEEGEQPDEVTTVEPTCVDCSSFNLVKEEKYIVSGWVNLMNKVGENYVPVSIYNYTGTYIGVSYLDSGGALIGGSELKFYPIGEIIDGWQKIQGEITIPLTIDNIKIGLINENEDLYAFFDDIRVHPFNGNLKSFVYDQETQKLMAELDENNYATFYEYDKEGGLIRVKKETERGVFTIQETRSSTIKKQP